MDETTRNVSKVIRELQGEIGGAIPVEDIVTLAGERGISETETHKAIDELETDGIITRINDETIEFI